MKVVNCKEVRYIFGIAVVDMLIKVVNIYLIVAFDFYDVQRAEVGHKDQLDYHNG